MRTALYVFLVYYVVVALWVACGNASAAREDKRNIMSLRNRIIEPIVAPFVLLKIAALLMASLFQRQPRLSVGIVIRPEGRPREDLTSPCWDDKAEPENLPQGE